MRKAASCRLPRVHHSRGNPRPAGVLFALLLMLWPLLPGFAEETPVPDPASVTVVDLGEGYRKLSQVMEILDQYPNLQHADMFGTPVGLRQVAQLEERYPGVTFGWTLKIGDHQVRTDATAFSTLHLSGSAIHSTEEISLLRYCTRLKALDFGHNGCNDLSFLAGLTELRVLIIAVNRVRDISPLANLTQLEYLELFSNHITDLSPLEGLTHLMDLNIAYNDIEDYSPLYRMPWLKRLWMYNSRNRDRKEPIPQDVLDTLARRLPETEINYTSMPTAGTWREHPHFEVIHAMFRSPDGYMPFEDSWPEFSVIDEEDAETAFPSDPPRTAAP